jgi:putative phosphoesterase
VTLMKLLFLSDWHLDLNQRVSEKNLLNEMIRFIKNQKADYMIVAGDIAESAKQTINIIERIEKETKTKIKFVPGNHDIRTSEASSWNEYEKLKNHSSSLIDTPLELPNNYVVIGDMGWYDYSFKPDFMDNEEVRMHKGNLWKDALYAKWGMSDGELYDLMQEKFKTQLEKYSGKKVIFVNHFLPYANFLKFKKDLEWNTCNSFMGSKSLGELLDSYENIEYVAFGHTHARFGEKKLGNKTILCSPLGFPAEWGSKDFAKEIESVSITVEI